MNIWLKAILRQLLGESKDMPGQPGLVFTKKCLQKMKDWNLARTDVEDVFQHGQLRGENMLIRKYNGYEIGMYYFRDKKTGNYIVSAAWKQENR